MIRSLSDLALADVPSLVYAALAAAVAFGAVVGVAAVLLFAAVSQGD